MQTLSQIGNARREERVLLPALVELRSEQGDEALTADGLDVSPSGLSVRAAFVPEVGTRLMLSFRCPLYDDAVQALGEVVWSSWDGPRIGSFGMRFLELDTKSATAIRRFVAPDALPVAEPEPPPVAIMRIDGLAAPIEADVRLYDKACIVLEQELGFLRLGRGIEVDVPGRGKERGRIASIELRQGPLDTPTLVFGILLDERREAPVPEQPSAPQAFVSASEVSAAGAVEQGEPPIQVAARVELASEPTPAPRAEASERPSEDQPRVVRARASVQAPAVELDEDAAVEAALKNRAPELWLALSKALSATFGWLRDTLAPALLATFARMRALFSGSDDQAWPVQVLVSLARVRHACGSLFSRAWKSAQKRRTTAAPVARVQRASAASVAPAARPPRNPPRNRRWLTVALAALGVGLGVYALAPRSGADRIRVPRAVPALTHSESVEAPKPALTELKVPVASAEPLLSAAPVPAQINDHATVGEAAEPSPASSRFGEPNVPNGRVFALRMSGPVQGLEGESREDGFSVRIPGRLALDRASPIATSHRAVARALILNRGEYAELTVEFLPGMRPKYQVAAKDSTIEVTLERL